MENRIIYGLLSLIAIVAVICVACYVVRYKAQDAIVQACVSNGQFEIGGYTYGCWLVASTLPQELP